MTLASLEWKNVTFLIGLIGLILGGVFLNYPDWDIPISFLMAGCTYLTADKFINAIKEKSYLKVALFSIGVWVSVDGIYWLYWSLVNTSVMIREGQWLASLCLYLLCGLIWTAFPAGISPTILRQHQQDLGLSGSKKGLNETFP